MATTGAPKEPRLRQLTGTHWKDVANRFADVVFTLAVNSSVCSALTVFSNHRHRTHRAGLALGKGRVAQVPHFEDVHPWRWWDFFTVVCSCNANPP